MSDRYFPGAVVSAAPSEFVPLSFKANATSNPSGVQSCKIRPAPAAACSIRQVPSWCTKRRDPSGKRASSTVCGILGRVISRLLRTSNGSTILVSYASDSDEVHPQVSTARQNRPGGKLIAFDRTLVRWRSIHQSPTALFPDGYSRNLSNLTADDACRIYSIAPLFDGARPSIPDAAGAIAVVNDR